MKTQLFKRVTQKYLPSDVSVIFFTDGKIFTVATLKKTQNDWQNISINQEEKHRDRTPAYTINVQSLMTSVSKLHVVDVTPVWRLLIAELRLLRSI